MDKRCDYSFRRFSAAQKGGFRVKRQAGTVEFSLIMIILLVVVYLPQMMKPGGITFGIIQDITNIYGYYPWELFMTRQLRAGYFPLWNPHNALGEPFLANMLTSTFYPLTWIKVIADMNLTVLDLILVLRLFLAGIFMFWFLNDIKLNFWGSAFGAASFATTGYFTRHVYLSHLNVEILLPLILLCFGRLARERNRKWFIYSVICVWLTMVASYPEPALYSILVGLFWYFYCLYRSEGFYGPGDKAAETRGYKRKGLASAALTISGALALGTGLGLCPSLPFVEYLANTWSYHVPGIGMGHLESKYAFTLVFPWFFGTNDVSPLVPFLAPYVGVAPAVFGIAGALRRGRKGLFFLIGAVFFFGVIYGIYPFILIGKIYPLDITLNFKYAVLYFAFCVSARTVSDSSSLIRNSAPSGGH
jgi:hypothetical protein